MSISIKSLLDAGAHFGHQTHRWNPKMKPFIFGARSGIYIINLEKTLERWNVAQKTIAEVVGRGGKVLFVGTKPQAQEIIEEEATRSGQYYVNRRWLGGMLTNFPTIKKRIERLKDLEALLASDAVADYSKKDTSRLEKERQKLVRDLSGIRNMERIPQLVVVVDPNKEHIAIAEARKLNIPTIAIADTNCDPDGIDYILPANDDALKSIRLFFTEIADTCLKASKSYEAEMQKQMAEKKAADEKRAAEAAAAKAAAEKEAPAQKAAPKPVTAGEGGPVVEKKDLAQSPAKAQHKVTPKVATKKDKDKLAAPLVDTKPAVKTDIETKPENN
jgi:small subunit ribosomal protein S2